MTKKQLRFFRKRGRREIATAYHELFLLLRDMDEGDYDSPEHVLLVRNFGNIFSITQIDKRDALSEILPNELVLTAFTVFKRRIEVHRNFVGLSFQDQDSHEIILGGEVYEEAQERGWLDASNAEIQALTRELRLAKPMTK